MMPTSDILRQHTANVLDFHLAARTVDVCDKHQYKSRVRGNLKTLLTVAPAENAHPLSGSLHETTTSGGYITATT